MSESNDTVLGRETAYPEVYQPELLYAIPRQQSRNELGIPQEIPFAGFDLWTAYELSWLDKAGKPVVAVGEFAVPCTTDNIVESKSLKLYLNSLNNTGFSSVQEVARVIETDLSDCANGPVQVDLHTLDKCRSTGLASLPGECLDNMAIAVDEYTPDPSLLGLADNPEQVTESLYSHLLKTNCPVTGQPDWGSIMVRYTGSQLDRAGLLKYIISYRNHQDFHEQCVERIFVEIMDTCQPDELEVYARYTRRGGLDINPYRSSEQRGLPRLRLSRQ